MGDDKIKDVIKRTAPVWVTGFYCVTCLSGRERIYIIVEMLFFRSGDGGIRTRVPEKGKRISSAPRYDHFDTSPDVWCVGKFKFAVLFGSGASSYTGLCVI